MLNQFRAAWVALNERGFLRCPPQRMSVDIKVAELLSMPKQDRAFLRMKAIDQITPMPEALSMVNQVAGYVVEDRIDEIQEYVDPPVEERRPRGSFGQILDG